MQLTQESTSEGSRPRSVAGNVIRGSLGNLIEWYDWYAYAAFSIYFAGVFFPSGNPTAQLLNTAGIFAVGFLMRPLGGWLFGWYADRFGRRAALTLSVTVMGVGSLGIALTPGYADIGALAPVLLVTARLLQGLSLGGEYGTSATYLSEVATPHRRGFYSSFHRYHEVYGEGVVIVDTDGRTLAARELTSTDPGVAAAVNRALVDAPAPPWSRILPWDTHSVLTATGVRRNGELVGAVALAVDTTVAARDVARGWVWVSIGCLALLLLAVVAARALTRWVLRPLDGLERAVAEMTEGVAGPPVDVTGPPELRHFTSAFNTMAGVVRSSLDRQRRLVADASHQLRNPLAAIRLRADSLDTYVAEGGRSTYDSMAAELDRLENLLQQLLRLARAEEASGSRRVGLDTAPAENTDLDDLIRERIAFWEPVAHSQNQHLRHRPDSHGLAVRIARHDVEQLLDVAVDNALRYAGPDTTVSVSTVPRDGLVDLIVSDDGRGLPAEDLQRAVTRFWRGHDGGTGTGLGLAIAGEIAAGHGGTIAVEQAPEGGLLVRYSLPTGGDST